MSTGDKENGRETGPTGPCDGALPDGAKTDVTTKVQEMVKDDALSVDATNDNFGDPIEGTVKKMKVEYLFNGGAKKEKEVAENETLAISNKGE